MGSQVLKKGPEENSSATGSLDAHLVSLSVSIPSLLQRNVTTENKLTVNGAKRLIVSPVSPK